MWIQPAAEQLERHGVRLLQVLDPRDAVAIDADHVGAGQPTSVRTESYLRLTYIQVKCHHKSVVVVADQLVSGLSELPAIGPDRKQPLTTKEWLRRDPRERPRVQPDARRTGPRASPARPREPGKA